jgi:phosphoglycerate dehydrogenase-like enzyme
LVTDAFWDAGLPLCSAWQANAVPVSETAYALIVLYLKRLPWFSARFRGDRAKPPMPPGGVPGLYEGVVGLVSLGAIGARVAGRLKAAKIKTLAFDPFLTVEKAKLLNVESVSLLELFERSDVVSLHTPLLEETQGMIGSRYLAAMKPGAALINTARGALIREEEFVEVFRKREDLSAFLDVTYPEPPAQDSPLWSLPNVTLAPHVAGSMGNEARRHGQMMLEEYMRFLDGQPLLYRVTRDQAKTMA